MSENRVMTLGCINRTKESAQGSQQPEVLRTAKLLDLMPENYNARLIEILGLIENNEIIEEIEASHWTADIVIQACDKVIRWIIADNYLNTKKGSDRNRKPTNDSVKLMANCLKEHPSILLLCEEATQQQFMGALIQSPILKDVYESMYHQIEFETIINEDTVVTLKKCFEDELGKDGIINPLYEVFQETALKMVDSAKIIEYLKEFWENPQRHDRQALTGFLKNGRFESFSDDYKAETGLRFLMSMIAAEQFIIQQGWVLSLVNVYYVAFDLFEDNNALIQAFENNDFYFEGKFPIYENDELIGLLTPDPSKRTAVAPEKVSDSEVPKLVPLEIMRFYSLVEDSVDKITEAGFNTDLLKYFVFVFSGSMGSLDRYLNASNKNVDIARGLIKLSKDNADDKARYENIIQLCHWLNLAFLGAAYIKNVVHENDRIRATAASVALFANESKPIFKILLPLVEVFSIASSNTSSGFSPGLNNSGILTFVSIIGPSKNTNIIATYFSALDSVSPSPLKFFAKSEANSCDR